MCDGSLGVIAMLVQLVVDDAARLQPLFIYDSQSLRCPVNRSGAVVVERLRC